LVSDGGAFALGICGVSLDCGGAENVAVCERSTTTNSYLAMGSYPSTLLAGGSPNNPSAVFHMTFTKGTKK